MLWSQARPNQISFNALSSACGGRWWRSLWAFQATEKPNGRLAGFKNLGFGGTDVACNVKHEEYIGIAAEKSHQFIQCEYVRG